MYIPVAVAVVETVPVATLTAGRETQFVLSLLASKVRVAEKVPVTLKRHVRMSSTLNVDPFPVPVAADWRVLFKKRGGKSWGV